MGKSLLLILPTNDKSENEEVIALIVEFSMFYVFIHSCFKILPSQASRVYYF